MQLTLRPAIEFPVDQLADVMNRSFEGYMVPVHITSAGILSMVRTDSVFLENSLVAVSGDDPAGIVLIARRDNDSRVAAMGVATPYRGKGVGRSLMERALSDCKERGDKRMILEVIVGNTAAIKLYESLGFGITSELRGYLGSALLTGEGDLEEVSPSEVAKQMLLHAEPDLPWQISPESVSLTVRPGRAFRLGEAYIAITDPAQANVLVRGFVVSSHSRRQGHGRRLFGALARTYPERNWRILPLMPPALPEEFFTSVGFKRDELAQYQMIHAG